MKRLAFLLVTAMLLWPAGGARADIGRGVDLFERGRYDEAAVELSSLAEVGVPEAQYLLGVMYLNLMVEPPEANSALSMVKAAAESGYLPAQSELARMYRAGDGVEQIAFCPDGKTLAVASANELVSLWDAATGQQPGVLVGQCLLQEHDGSLPADALQRKDRLLA